MRILRNQGCFFSKDNGNNSGVLELSAPKSWSELTQDQLRYVFFLLSRFSELEVKTYMFLRFSGIQVVKKTSEGALCYIRNNGAGKKQYFELKTWQIQSLCHNYDFIDSYESMRVRLDDIQGFHAVDVILKDVVFIDYLNMEQYYQSYMSTHDSKYLKQLGCLLYRDDNEDAGVFTPDLTEQTAIFYWFSYVKSLYAKLFPHFFRPAAGGNKENSTFLQMANAQLRALTEGDITKEEQVKQTPCLRALTELDEKAREALNAHSA